MSRCDAVLDRFLEYVRRAPSALSVVDGNIKCTYAELDELSSSYASALDRGGVLSGQIIALEIRKGFKAYALIIACIKLGCPYFFLDLRSTNTRNQKILSRASPAIIITEGVDGLENGSLRRVNLQVLELAKALPLEHWAPRRPEDPVYIMFTSGSTGEPKGVVICSRGILMLVEWARFFHGISSEDRLSNLNPLHFDNSVFDIYCSLLNGAAIIAVDTEFTPNISLSIAVLTKAEATIVFAVPTYFMMANKLRTLSSDQLRKVRIVQFGGEGYPIPALKELRAAFDPSVRLINVYGPTECSCICTGLDVSSEMLAASGGLPPLGILNSGFYFRIRDAEGTELPADTPGELWIAGPAISIGYLNNEQETSARFSPCPWPDAAGWMMYRTGDIVRLNSKTGYIEFVGRIDNQVKIRGHRIELEEIDLALQGLCGITRAVTVVLTNELDSAVLVTAVAVADGSFDERAAISAARQRLPAYMLPQRIIALDEMPLNRSGKADRRAVGERLTPYVKSNQP